MLQPRAACTLAPALLLAVGLGAESADSAASPFNGPLQPLDRFRVLSQPYTRPELLCAFRHPLLYPGPAHGLGASAGGPCSCIACHSGTANGLAPRAAAASDFTCASTSCTDSFLTFVPSVLSKASSVALDQREEMPLTRYGAASWLPAGSKTPVVSPPPLGLSQPRSWPPGRQR
ncbi:Homeobox even-skipped protein 1 [Saguinus oedipus]|uniref:Homeobox even-skipped protein 1 n=1 Tax=Saguinus oedipus TaxID=9490 RepID=A0ABQ9UNZ6_SAGOE|nr:Homeobox even-skipped protein 1 [Saguinus oedipus]